MALVESISFGLVVPIVSKVVDPGERSRRESIFEQQKGKRLI
jgi:hypothetical protein